MKIFRAQNDSIEKNDISMQINSNRERERQIDIKNDR